MDEKQIKEIVEVAFKNYDSEDISSILNKYFEVSVMVRLCEKERERMKTKIKTFLKERKWDKYLDKKTKVNVSINMRKKETIDKEQLKQLVTPALYAQVLQINKYEVMSIITPEDRKRLKKYVRK